MAGILEEGPIRKLLREKGILKRSPEIRDVEAAIRHLRDAIDRINSAIGNASHMPEAALRNISEAYEELRWAEGYLR